MPMSARRSAGASLTPSPVIATVWPSRAQRVDHVQLRLRVAARDDQLGAARAAARRAPPRASRRLGPVTTWACPPTIPASRATAAAVSPWSPVMTMIRMPARRQRATASGTSARGGSCSAARPRNVSPGSAASRGSASSPSAPGSAKPSTRRPRRRSPRRRRGTAPRGLVERPLRRGGAQRRAALEQLERRAFGVQPSAVRLGVERRHALAPRVEVRTAAACASRSAWRRAVVRARGRQEQRALARIAAALPAVVAPGVMGVVAAHGGAQQREPGSAAPATSPRARSSRPAQQSPYIRPSVSVPVLSVQMTSVEPSVSTAVSRLTSARRAAIRRTPTASASVIVGSSPSGTLATSSPIANDERVGQRQPGDQGADREEHHTSDDGDGRDQLRGAVDLELQRAELRLDALRQRGDPAELLSPCRWRRPPPARRRRCTACRRTRGRRLRGATRPASRARRSARPTATRR